MHLCSLIFSFCFFFHFFSSNVLICSGFTVLFAYAFERAYVCSCMCAHVTPFSCSEGCIAGWRISFSQLLIWPRWVTADTCLSHAEQLTWKLMFHISDHLSLLQCRKAEEEECICVRISFHVCVCENVSVAVSLCSFEDGHACGG